MTKNSKYIFYLDRQKLIIAGTELATPLTLQFPTNIVLDIDVIDTESFDLLLTNFIEQSKIIPADILLIMSPDVYYEKNITLPTDPTERQNQIDLFLQTIPFKHLIYKDYVISNQPRLIALNKNFHEPLLKFIKKSNFSVISIIPAFVLEHFQLSLSKYEPVEVKAIYKKLKLFETYSLISSQDINKIVNISIQRPKEDNFRAIILLIVFCLLFVVLLFLMYVRPKMMKPPVPKVVPTKNISAPTPLPSIEQPTPTPSIIYTAPELLRIKTINSSGIPNQAAKIKQALTAAGFSQITTTSSSVVTAAKNQISFSGSVSPDSRQKIRDAVEAIAGISSELELSDSTEVNVLIISTARLAAQPTP